MQNFSVCKILWVNRIYGTDFIEWINNQKKIILKTEDLKYEGTYIIQFTNGWRKKTKKKNTIYGQLFTH